MQPTWQCILWEKQFEDLCWSRCGDTPTMSSHWPDWGPLKRAKCPCRTATTRILSELIVNPPEQERRWITGWSLQVKLGNKIWPCVIFTSVLHSVWMTMFSRVGIQWQVYNVASKKVSDHWVKIGGTMRVTWGPACTTIWISFWRLNKTKNSLIPSCG